MSLWRRRSLPMPTAADQIPPRPVIRAGTVTVTNETALRHSAVWACLRLRADLVSTMPIDVFRRVNGQQIEAPKPPVLRAPSGDRVDMLEWMYSTQFDLDRAGNAFGIITETNGRGLPARIDLVPLSEVTVVVRRGELSYRIAGQTYEPDVVWHEKQFTVAGLHVGLSPTAHAAWSIGEYQSIQQFALDWFGAGTIPAAQLKNVNKTIKSGEAETIKARFKAAVAGRDLFVTGADWEYKMIQAEQASADWIEAKKFGIGDIARYYGCPGDLIDAAVATGSITYANITQRNLQFLIMNLGPAIVRREARLTSLTPQPQYVKLNTDALLRMDPKTRADMFKVQIESRQRVPSEVRDLDNLAPYTEEQLTEFDRLFGAPGAGSAEPEQPEAAAEDGETDPASRHLPGKHDQSTHGRRKGKAGVYQPGKDLIGKGTGAAIANDAGAQAILNGRHTDRGDETLHAIVTKQGFHGKPKVVDKAEMDSLVKDHGHTEVHRGVNAHGGRQAHELHEQFRTGDYYAGYGIYGNGTYTARNRSVATAYSDHSKGSMLRAGLRPEAKIIHYNDLQIEHNSFMYKVKGGTIQETVFSDVGRYAAARGYDAIQVMSGMSSYFVILNRTALIVQKGD